MLLERSAHGTEYFARKLAKFAGAGALVPITGFATFCSCGSDRISDGGRGLLARAPRFFLSLALLFYTVSQVRRISRSDLLDIENLWCRGLICTRLDTFHCEESGSPDFCTVKKRLPVVMSG